MIGTGGYVCGPVVYAAAKLKIPTIVHEQNSVPGLTNKFLSRYVNKVAVCFEEAKDYFPENKVVFTGNPRATEVIGKDGITRQDFCRIKYENAIGINLWGKPRSKTY